VIGEPFSVLVALIALVWLAIWLERQWKVTRALGSVLTAILLAALAANIGVLPGRSEAYVWLGGPGVNVAIALILLGIDVRTIVAAGPRMLGAFLVGALGTAAGALVGAAVLHGWLGPDTWKLAGQYTGTYTGGSVNFVAVGEIVGTSPNLYAAAVAADNVTTTVWMAVCLALPALPARWWGGITAEPSAGAAADAMETVTFVATRRAVTVQDVAVVATLALGAFWFSEKMSGWMPAVPAVLWLTTIALGMAQIPAVRRLAGGPLWGNYLMHLFLATIGAQSILGEIMRVGPAVFYYTLIVVSIHGLVLFGLGRVFRTDLATLAVASQANVGGPASAMALATARGYADRILPGVAVGLLGYAVGTYAGFGVAHLARGLFGT